MALLPILALALMAADTTLSGPESGAVDAVPDSVLEFHLPLRGEVVSGRGTGILVQAGPSARSVVLSWKGSGQGTDTGEAQGFGFFAGNTGPIPAGEWTLTARALDSAGREIARGQVAFRAGQRSASTVPSAPSPASARAQNLHLQLAAGFRDGSSEEPMASSTDLVPGAGGIAMGDRWEPLDPHLSGSGMAQYDFRQGEFRLRARGSTDLSETWGHAASPSRAGLDLWYGPWAEIHLGDQYPQWSALLMDGSRVRGLGAGAVATWQGAPLLRADFAWGELRPGVDAQRRVFRSGEVDTLPVQFARRIELVHLGLGLGTPVEAHFTALHSKDDASSADLPLQDTLGGAPPEENLALAGELSVKLWGGAVELYSGAAASLVTEDARNSSALDSLRSDGDVRLPSLLSDLFTFNLSTRGTEHFLTGEGDLAGFLSDNSSWRGGGRFALPLGDAGRARFDLRWVHAGPQFESFARAVRETPRTGLEWTATGLFARDQFLVVSSGKVVDNHPAVGLDVPSSSANLTCAWTPFDGGPGVHASSGALRDGGGDQMRIEGWNAGLGAFGTRRTAAGPLSWSADWTVNATVSRAGGVDTSISTRILVNDLDLAARWRPEPMSELRLGYQLGDSKIPLDSLPEHREQDHRIAAGMSHWWLARKLEFALDGGISLRSGDAETDLSGWSQSARVRWDLAQGQVLRLAETANRVQARHDLRVDAGWEAWF